MALAEVTPTQLATRSLWWLHRCGFPDTDPLSRAVRECKYNWAGPGAPLGTGTSPSVTWGLELITCDPLISRASGSESALPAYLLTNLF